MQRLLKHLSSLGVAETEVVWFKAMLSPIQPEPHYGTPVTVNTMQGWDHEVEVPVWYCQTRFTFRLYTNRSLARIIGIRGSEWSKKALGTHEVAILHDRSGTWNSMDRLADYALGLPVSE